MSGVQEMKFTQLCLEERKKRFAEKICRRSFQIFTNGKKKQGCAIYLTKFSAEE